MREDALKYFRCPKCGRETLSIAISEKEHIKTHIICEKCHQTFPIKNNIPRFVSVDNYAESFGYQWNIHAKTQLDSYTGTSISHDRLFQVTGWPENMEGQMILEAGSGAGRFTEILLGTGATIFSFDYSIAVDANWENNGESQNLNLFQGDIYNIPLKKGKFDKVMCLGVIQHTPDPKKAFNSLAEQVCPNGELVVDVYTRSAISLLQWKYIFRPITKHMNKEHLYKIISTIVPAMLPVAIFMRHIAGKVGARLMPIVEYSHLGLPYEINKQWAILDTFDMYSPAHDYPQSISTVRKWFSEIGFHEVTVEYGLNGVIAKGRRPLSVSSDSLE